MSGDIQPNDERRGLLSYAIEAFRLGFCASSSDHAEVLALQEIHPDIAGITPEEICRPILRLCQQHRDAFPGTRTVLIQRERSFQGYALNTDSMIECCVMSFWLALNVDVVVLHAGQITNALRLPRSFRAVRLAILASDGSASLQAHSNLRPSYWISNHAINDFRQLRARNRLLPLRAFAAFVHFVRVV